MNSEELGGTWRNSEELGGTWKTWEEPVETQRISEELQGMLSNAQQQLFTSPPLFH